MEVTIANPKGEVPLEEYRQLYKDVTKIAAAEEETLVIQKSLDFNQT